MCLVGSFVANNFTNRDSSMYFSFVGPNRLSHQSSRSSEDKSLHRTKHSHHWSEVLAKFISFFLDRYSCGHRLT